MEASTSSIQLTRDLAEVYGVLPRELYRGLPYEDVLKPAYLAIQCLEVNPQMTPEEVRTALALESDEFEALFCGFFGPWVSGEMMAKRFLTLALIKEGTAT